MRKKLRTKLSRSSSRHRYLIRPHLESLEARLAPAAMDVLTYHNDNLRTGLNPSETILTPANVNQYSFGKLFSYPVDGQVFAQPLYKANLTIPGQGTYNVVFVATEHDTVYAFNADSQTGGPNNDGLLWKTSFNNGTTITSVRARGNPHTFYDAVNNPLAVLVVQPEVGITSTPVINGNTLYVVTLTQEVPANSTIADYKYTLRALNITTGAQTASNVLADTSRPYPDPLESDPGTYVSGPCVGTVCFLATRQLQRPALTFSGGKIYSIFGDFSEYKKNPHDGWVLSNNASDLSSAGAIATIPNPPSPDPCVDEEDECGQAGIWMSGDGPAVDSAGNLFVATGDGHFDSTIGDYGDSILRLPSNLSGVTGAFTPYNQDSLVANDTDLGSGGVLALPDQPGPYQHLVIQTGKSGTIYVLNRDDPDLGGFKEGQPCDPQNPGPDCDRVVQHLQGAIHGSFDTPAYFNGEVYYAAAGDSLKAFRLTNGLLSSTPVQSFNTFRFPGATPSVSANGTANGIVWVLESGALDSMTDQPTTPAILHAYQAAPFVNCIGNICNASQYLLELYNSSQAGSRDQLDTAVKFAVPTISNGKVYVGTNSTLTVLGSITSPAVGPNSLIQSDYMTNGQNDYEVVTLEGSSLKHYSFLPGIGWQFDETVPTLGAATGPAALIQSDYMDNMHKHLEVVVPEGNALRHYTFIDGRGWEYDDTVTTNATGPASLIQREDYLAQGHGYLEVVVPEGAFLNHYTFIQGTGWQFDNTVVTDAIGPGALTQSDYLTNGHGNLEVVVPELNNSTHMNDLNHYTLTDGSSSWVGDDTVISQPTGSAFGPASMILSDYMTNSHLHVEVVVPIGSNLNHYTFVDGSGWEFDDTVTTQIAGPASMILSDDITNTHRHVEVVVPVVTSLGTSLNHYTFSDGGTWQLVDVVTTGSGPSAVFPSKRPPQDDGLENQLSDGLGLHPLSGQPFQPPEMIVSSVDGLDLSGSRWLLDAAFIQARGRTDALSTAGELLTLLTGENGAPDVFDLPFDEFGGPFGQ